VWVQAWWKVVWGVQDILLVCWVGFGTVCEYWCCWDVGFEVKLNGEERDGMGLRSTEYMEGWRTIGRLKKAFVGLVKGQRMLCLALC
jgi:hypothetical protein